MAKLSWCSERKPQETGHWKFEPRISPPVAGESTEVKPSGLHQGGVAVLLLARSQRMQGLEGPTGSEWLKLRLGVVVGCKMAIEC